jgi:hypothetical protein
MAAPTPTPVTDFIKELFPAAIVTGPEIDDSRSWDPMSLSLLPADPSSISEDETLVMRPATPDSMADRKEDQPIDVFSSNEPDSAFARGPFGIPPWEVYKPDATLPPPIVTSSCESSVVYFHRDTLTRWG